MVNQSLANIILDKLYPVGSIYLETTNTNPSAKLGGEWTTYGSSDSYLRLGGSGSGGSNSVKLVANQIPTLTGTATSTTSTFTAFTKYGVGAGTNTTITSNKMSEDTYGGGGNHFWQGTYQNAHTHSVSIPNSSQRSVTIAPKYVQVYAWKRIK